MVYGTQIPPIGVRHTAMLTVRQARLAALAEWNRTLANAGGMNHIGEISGSSPPSVFVGSQGYPNVQAGPMLPPRFGDTAILDKPEMWAGMSLSEIVSYRFGMVRGVRTVSAKASADRYMESLQEIAMGSRPVDARLDFVGGLRMMGAADGYSAPFGPVGSLRESHVCNATPDRAIQRCYTDTDMTATDAIMRLYREGIDVSRIQKCLSVGIFGQTRRIVPTKWSITATDDTISAKLTRDISEYPLDDAYRLFEYEHLGNTYRVIVWPRRWAFGFAEAWHASGTPVVGADSEDIGGLRRYPETEGAYHAARLAVTEYLASRRRQAGTLVFRDISPAYSIPVGVWQVREGIRMALREQPVFAGSLQDAVKAALKGLSTPPNLWLERPAISRLLFQRTITEY